MALDNTTVIAWILIRRYIYDKGTKINKYDDICRSLLFLVFFLNFSLSVVFTFCHYSSASKACTSEGFFFGIILISAILFSSFLLYSANYIIQSY